MAGRGSAHLVDLLTHELHAQSCGLRVGRTSTELLSRQNGSVTVGFGLRGPVGLGKIGFNSPLGVSSCTVCFYRCLIGSRFCSKCTFLLIQCSSECCFVCHRGSLVVKQLRAQLENHSVLICKTGVIDSKAISLRSPDAPPIIDHHIDYHVGDERIRIGRRQFGDSLLRRRLPLFESRRLRTKCNRRPCNLVHRQRRRSYGRLRRWSYRCLRRRSYGRLRRWSYGWLRRRSYRRLRRWSYRWLRRWIEERRFPHGSSYGSRAFVVIDLRTVEERSVLTEFRPIDEHSNRFGDCFCSSI